ncbi:hypothetical protein L6164_023667 [Bauhinia variegata]|uniref:Uncharacterized protein n=1 Tax=Bauhinia variegata TaxID=167791 RepID=A0ACB9MIW7_BAUVA|nr:hypothetical protein L6164_023667 [Bauhinia variegata]
MFANDLILFAEASVEQFHEVEKCLKRFVEICSQRVGMEDERLHWLKAIDDSFSTLSAYRVLAEGMWNRREASWSRIWKWLGPEAGWVKLNSNGTSRDNPGRVGRGALLWDERGHWIAGTSRRLGITTTFTNEKWGLLDRFIVVLDERFRKVIVECDSLVLVQWINNNRIGSFLTSLLWLRILELLDRHWEVEVIHTMRKGNKSANWLANSRVGRDIGLETLDTPPMELVGIL